MQQKVRRRLGRQERRVSTGAWHGCTALGRDMAAHGHMGCGTCRVMPPAGCTCGLAAAAGVVVALLLLLPLLRRWQCSAPIDPAATVPPPAPIHDRYLAHGTATDYMYSKLGVPVSLTWEVYGDTKVGGKQADAVCTERCKAQGASMPARTQLPCGRHGACVPDTASLSQQVPHLLVLPAWRMTSTRPTH